ncbi:MAG: aromatic amino acid lyase [Bacteroidetes bacterium]|nr:MAG: aromatic amino acid lyase [Bacteroidota bacterium]
MPAKYHNKTTTPRMNENENPVVRLDGKTLTLEALIDIAEKGRKVEFPVHVKEHIKACRQLLEDQIQNRPDIAIYGTNRLHGDLKDLEISPDIIDQYQEKYAAVHNCGTGKPLPVKTARAIMAIRLNSFAKGMSGIRLETCELMLDMLNTGVTPWILEEGSVGASGDLVPLGMMLATMIQMRGARAYYKGKLMSARKAFKKSGLSEKYAGYTLKAKEAMGITNGSNFIAAVALFAWRDAMTILKTASIAAALSVEAVRGEKKAFSTIINEKSHRHRGQIVIARQMRALLKGSKRTTPEAQKHPFTGTRPGNERVQDRYSFRAVPQVHGAAWEALQKLADTLETEINSVTDNPLFDFRHTDKNTGGILFASGANFHGQALATVIDYAKIAMTSVGLMSDKRAFSMLDHRLSYGLPPDLAYDTSSGDGGLMITQYAGAARAAENRILSTPASVMSLSTAANQEDFVSMGSLGAVHFTKIIRNLQIILGVELLCATRALQMTYDKLPKRLRKLGAGTQKALDFLSQQEQLDTGEAVWRDHYLRKDMKRATRIVKSGALVSAVMN